MNNLKMYYAEMRHHIYLNNVEVIYDHIVLKFSFIMFVECF